MKLKVLMIDDHPSMLEGYKIILSYNTMGYEILTTVAHDCEQAYKIITDTKNKPSFDIVLLDYSLPPFESKNINNGEDLGVLIKKKLPKCKVIMLTSHTEGLLLYNITKNVIPEGLLVKSDFSAEELIIAFERIMDGNKYQSATVIERVQEFLSKKQFLDHFNRQIITLLAEGVKTKNIPNYMNLSISAIEKRKVIIREYFSIEKGSDEDIIREARKLGFV
jgi:two-component system, NarL family, response regulator NreC